MKSKLIIGLLFVVFLLVGCLVYLHFAYPFSYEITEVPAQIIKMKPMAFYSPCEDIDYDNKFFWEGMKQRGLFPIIDVRTGEPIKKPVGCD